MKVFISGTSGFLGGHLLRVLRAQKYEAVGVNRSMMPNSLTFEQFKVNETPGKKIFIHCAGLVHSKLSDYDNFYDANVKLSKELGTVALKNNFSKFIYISTIGVFGTSKNEVSVLSKNDPHDAYTQSKNDAEDELKKIFKNSSCKLIIVRPPLIIGKNAPGNIKLIEKLLNAFPITPFGMVNNSKSIIKIETLCETLANFDNLQDNLIMPSEKLPLSTSEIFDLVAKYNNKKFYHLPIPIKIINLLLTLLKKDNLQKNLTGDLVIK